MFEDNETKQRIIQEFVPGKQVTLAHLIANPDKSLYKKLGFTRVDRGESKYPSADMEFELII